MVKKKIIFGLLALTVLIVVYINLNVSTSNSNKKQSEYYVVENDEEIYYEDYKFIDEVFNFDSVLDKTIISFNEIKDGKRDLKFVSEIESKELKSDEEYRAFKRFVPEASELKVESADVSSYKVTGLRYDKNQSIIKVFIEIETHERHNGRSTKVINNQTYIYKIDNSKLLLMKYHFSQHL